MLRGPRAQVSVSWNGGVFCSVASDYPHSFGACAFLASADRSLPLKQQLAVLKIPAGDTTYLDDGGRENPKWHGTVLLPDIATFWQLANTRGDQALVLDEGVYRGVLAELEGQKFWQDGPHVARVTFELTQWP